MTSVLCWLFASLDLFIMSSCQLISMDPHCFPSKSGPDGRYDKIVFGPENRGFYGYGLINFSSSGNIFLSKGNREFQSVQKCMFSGTSSRDNWVTVAHRRSMRFTIVRVISQIILWTASRGHPAQCLKTQTPPPSSGEKVMPEFDHFPMEFGAHIWWFCSPDEYFQLQTTRGIKIPPLSKTRIWNIGEISGKNKTPNLRLLRFLEKIKPGFVGEIPAREVREKKLGYFRRFTGGNAQKGVQKVPQNWWDFLKKIERLLRFLEKIKTPFWDCWDFWKK